MSTHGLDVLDNRTTGQYFKPSRKVFRGVTLPKDALSRTGYGGENCQSVQQRFG
jgi:hypothetical protein